MIESGGASLVYSDHGREVFACRNVDVVIKPNEFVGILGPSGSGKSSLLYLLSGLKIPTAGRILYEGQDLARKSDEERSRLRLKEFGFLFQQAFLLGYLTATMGTWSGIYWLSFGERPENFLAAGLLIFAVAFISFHGKSEFAPVYRIFGLLVVLIAVLVPVLTLRKKKVAPVDVPSEPMPPQEPLPPAS